MLYYSSLIISYWLVRMFDQYEQVPDKKRIAACRINRFLSENKLKCDMAIVELSEGFTSRVAALYEQNAEEFPHMYAIGVLDASSDIMKLGVVGALYYFSLENHHNNNTGVE